MSAHDDQVVVQFTRVLDNAPCDIVDFRSVHVDVYLCSVRETSLRHISQVGCRFLGIS
jgi:hypothetical protein